MIQYLNPVGFGPSRNTCPRWASHYTPRRPQKERVCACERYTKRKSDSTKGSQKLQFVQQITKMLTLLKIWIFWRNNSQTIIYLSTNISLEERTFKTRKKKKFLLFGWMKEKFKQFLGFSKRIRIFVICYCTYTTTSDFDAFHSKTVIWMFSDSILAYWLIERWPPCPRIKLCWWTMKKKKFKLAITKWYFIRRSMMKKRREETRTNSKSGASQQTHL